MKICVYVAALLMLTGCVTTSNTAKRGCRGNRCAARREAAVPACQPLVGRAAPAFTAACVTPENELSELSLANYRGRYVFLVFYPGDFTFVCPTELLALNEKRAEFVKRECDIIGMSVDSEHVHLAWKLAPDEQGGLGNLGYPLVSDNSKEIARKYGVLLDGKVALRGWFLIDRKGIVRHQLVNDLSHGRSVSEARRVLDAVRFTDTHQKVCPADWEEGDESLEPTRGGIINFLRSH